MDPILSLPDLRRGSEHAVTLFLLARFDLLFDHNGCEGRGIFLLLSLLWGRGEKRWGHRSLWLQWHNSRLPR